MSKVAVRFEDLRRAAERIRPWIHRTPILTCSHLDGLAGGRLFFKCENLQKVGAFKIRGATNAILSLSDEEARRGVATHSSGNHGAAVALAARNRRLPAYVVMPESSPRVKIAAVEGYGARVTLCEPTPEGREGGEEAIRRKTGAVSIHSFEDPRVIAGQGTAAMEILEDLPELDLLLTPVGGGGLVSGTALAAAGLAPDCRVIAAEPAGADDTLQSFRAGRRMPATGSGTIADGLRTGVGELTFAIIKRHVSEVIAVSEEEIVAAMRLVWERMKIVIEPSAAVPVAAVLGSGIDLAGRSVGIILTGGNVDLDRLPWGSGGRDDG